jgi:hypothetical protein
VFRRRTRRDLCAAMRERSRRLGPCISILLKLALERFCREIRRIRMRAKEARLSKRRRSSPILAS